MKSIKHLLTAAFAFVAFSAMAQQDFSAPQYARYGDTPEQRKRNIEYLNFLKESVSSKDYNAAAYYYQQISSDRPKVSVNIYKYAAIVYRNKIARSQSLDEQKVMIDSLLGVYDLRLEHFGNAAKEGAAYILDTKTRDVMKYKRNDIGAIRDAFNAALEVGGEATEPDLIVLYFTKLCDVYMNSDEV
ncbi:MAG: enzyme of heme biosynthesis, partial [Rikenellaceae bacterium]|nr:enzyme of heme biosynthesis [Rikenellaceae bacterium]